MKRIRPFSAFSLIEIVMAIGIIAFAFVALLGLLPAGLSTFRSSIDRTLSTQIAQRLIGEAIQTPSERLDQLYAKTFYFDGEGMPIDSHSGVPPGFIYSASVSPAEASVQDGNAAVTGLASIRSRVLVLRIAKNRSIRSQAGDPSLFQQAFVVSEVGL